MQRNANYALVGLAATLILIGLIVFSLWLMAFKVGGAYDYYDIVFKGPVRGLSEGGEVHFNGIKVGEVSRISLDTEDHTLVIARVDVDSDVPIRKDSYAVLEPQGITGLNFVQITAGTTSEPLLKDSVPHKSVPRIRSEPSPLSDLLDSGGNMIDRSVEALDRINRILSDENIERFNTTLQDLQTIATELRERKNIIADAERALLNVNEAALQVAELAESGNALVADAATDIAAAAKDLRSTMNKLEGPMSEFAVTGLPQITSAIASLQQAADNLDRTLTEVQQSPRGLVAKSPAQEIEVKP